MKYNNKMDDYVDPKIWEYLIKELNTLPVIDEDEDEDEDNDPKPIV